MSELPRPLRFAPFAFYGWAIVVIVTYFLNGWALADQIGYQYSSGMDAFDIVGELVKSQVFLSGISEGAYMASNGALIHVLIAIYDKMKGPGE